MRGPACVIMVENLPVPFDRRVWQEACALRDAGWTVSVICPQTEKYPQAFEMLDDIAIYRHPLTEANSKIAFAAARKPFAVSGTLEQAPAISTTAAASMHRGSMRRAPGNHSTFSCGCRLGPEG